jgi:predicted acyl esterase
MTKLTKKIAAVLADEDNKHAYLTGKEFVSLTKSRKVAVFNLFFAVDQFTEEGGNSFYYGLPSSVTVTRRQAVEVAEKFAEYDTRDGEQLYARVYISNWGTDKLYLTI